MIRLLICGIAFASCATTGTALAEATSEQFSPRVRALLEAMTLVEKTNLITGADDPDDRGQSGYAPGVPRLNVPPLRWGNGPIGIELAADATAMPGGLPLASSFDADLSRRVGVVLGREARALGLDVLNGPQVDVARNLLWGRNSTSLGEDPLLAGRLGAAQVEGIQTQGVLATAKHYFPYSQREHVRSSTRPNTNPYDFIVDSRTLHEIYLPPFEAAAKAGSASFMAAHTVVNGHYGSENKFNLTDILREEIGWQGFVVSDWHGTHSSYALAAGTDVEMPGYGTDDGPGRPHYFGDKLLAAIEAGRMPQALVDRAAGRLLGQMEKFGFLDGTRVQGPTAVEVEAGARLAREVATEGSVLLKNDGILPLRLQRSSALALIGPTAGQLAVGRGAGRAYGFEDREISPLAVIRRIAPRTSYAVGDSLTGEAIATTFLVPRSGTGSGLTRTSNAAVSTDATLDFVANKALPPRTEASWAGALSAPETGTYLLMIQSWGGSASLAVDGVEKATSAKFARGFARKSTSLMPTTDGLDNAQVTMRLEAGRAYRIDVRAKATGDAPVQVRLAWVTPQMRRTHIADAAKVARGADTAVVFAWAESVEGVAAEERLALANDQDELIDAVAAANPNTVVVLTTGGPVRMPWLSRVRAVLMTWYPGQEGGWATADLLTGRANPSGKLPLTFPARFEDSPTGDPAHPERSVGVDRKIVHTEGLFIGYRHYDRYDIQPLFPFGHGLSYTQFAYSDLKIGKAEGGIDVEFTVKNTGSRAGAETPQVYLGPSKADIPMPPKALAGFARIELAPGKAGQVRVHVPERQFAYWSVEDRSWIRPAGPRPVYVGASSRDIRLNGVIE
ncbi:MAG TPA: glycoside hydrolase family 3 C-terminal domain-containing protein [Steroidobacteraceae bacterium]|nr:glycoside hydrolase family 3 C-terminal domain-containing protein [Steroidobacteraceae bacterium]